MCPRPTITSLHYSYRTESRNHSSSVQEFQALGHPLPVHTPPQHRKPVQHYAPLHLPYVQCCRAHNAAVHGSFVHVHEGTHVPPGPHQTDRHQQVATPASKEAVTLTNSIRCLEIDTFLPVHCNQIILLDWVHAWTLLIKT